MSGTIIEIRSSEPRRAMVVLREQLQADSVGLFGDCVHVVTHEPDKTTTKTKEALMRAGLKLSGIRTIDPSLEDVFVSVIAGREGGNYLENR